MDKTLDLDEAIARLIDPSSWRVFDSELERVKRHHPNGGYDPDNFKDRASLALASRILTLIAAARPAVVSDEVVEAMARGFLEGLNEGRSLEFDALQPGDWAELRSAMRAALALLPGGEGEGSSLSQPSRTTQEPPSPTPCDLEGRDQ